MTPDQMISALMYRRNDSGEFDLSAEIDILVEMLATEQYSDMDRTTILRAILANLDEDIYRTDWTRLAHERREELVPALDDAVKRTKKSLVSATRFLASLGVPSGRLLPYSLQLVTLSAFFDKCPSPSQGQKALLARWFWVSSFSGWFGGANSSRVNNLLRELRDVVAPDAEPRELTSFNLETPALPYPTSFDMRSARSRCVLLALLDLLREKHGQVGVDHAVSDLARMGSSGVGRIYSRLPRGMSADPANRAFRPIKSPAGSMLDWIQEMIKARKTSELEAYAIDLEAAKAVEAGDGVSFITVRRATLIRVEQSFLSRRDVVASAASISDAPIDTE